MKVPSSRQIGVCTSQVMIMTANVNQTACQVPGSVRTWRQLCVPTNSMAPIPSQSVNESTRTPISGIKAKARNISRLEPPECRADSSRRPLGAAGSCSSVPVPTGARGARAVMSRLDGGVHRRRELLRRDLQQEQLIDIVQQSLGLLRAESLIPGLLEVGRD